MEFVQGLLQRHPAVGLNDDGAAAGGVVVDEGSKAEKYRSISLPFFSCCSPLCSPFLVLVASQKLLAEANTTAQGKVDQGGQADHEQSLTCKKKGPTWVHLLGKRHTSHGRFVQASQCRQNDLFRESEKPYPDAPHVYAGPDHLLHSRPHPLDRVSQQSKSLQMRELGWRWK